MYSGYLQHLASLPASDRRCRLYADSSRRALFATVLRALLAHTSHLERGVQLWHMDQLSRAMACFFTISFRAPEHASAAATTPAQTAAGAERSSGKPRVAWLQGRTKVHNFSLADEELRWLLLPSELSQLQRWAEALQRGQQRLVAPEDEREGAKAALLEALQAKRRSQQQQVELHAQEIVERAQMQADGEEEGMAFL